MTTKQAYKQKRTLIKVSVSTVLSEIVAQLSCGRRGIMVSMFDFRSFSFSYKLHALHINRHYCY